MLKIGDYVDFKLLGSDGKYHSTSDYSGKILVLYTYPKDNTPGCSIEAKGFSDLYDSYKENKAVVLGLNNNSLKSHQSFINKYCLPFPLLIDEDFILLNNLGATKGENKVARKTFIINEHGILEKIFLDVKPLIHPKEVLEYIKTRQ